MLTVYQLWLSSYNYFAALYFIYYSVADNYRNFERGFHLNKNASPVSVDDQNKKGGSLPALSIISHIQKQV